MYQVVHCMHKQLNSCTHLYSLVSYPTTIIVISISVHNIVGPKGKEQVKENIFLFNLT